MNYDEIVVANWITVYCELKVKVYISLSSVQFSQFFIKIWEIQRYIKRKIHINLKLYQLKIYESLYKIFYLYKLVINFV